jgi:hypothetical protein
LTALDDVDKAQRPRRPVRIGKRHQFLGFALLAAKPSAQDTRNRRKENSEALKSQIPNAFKTLKPKPAESC